MLKLRNITKTFNQGTVNERIALSNLSLNLEDGDFVTVIGGNGSGKSTLLNIIAGVEDVDWGNITLDGKDITFTPEYKRGRELGRVFQDPMKGTFGSMGIEENLAMAFGRGKPLGFGWGIKNQERKLYREKLKSLDLGLEDKMKLKVGLLSGGQRQAVTLLMATMQRPKLLLLDEHTAALDPKTAVKVLELTEEIVTKNKLTALMITHNMKDAIRYGNRIIMMDKGKIVLDIKGEEKNKLTVTELLLRFEIGEEQTEAFTA